jgi:hypothetical protein
VQRIFPNVSVGLPVLKLSRVCCLSVALNKQIGFSNKTSRHLPLQEDSFSAGPYLGSEAAFRAPPGSFHRLISCRYDAGQIDAPQPRSTNHLSHGNRQSRRRPTRLGLKSPSREKARCSDLLIIALAAGGERATDDVSAPTRAACAATASCLR